MGDSETLITPKANPNVVTLTKDASLWLLGQLAGSLAGQCLPSALGKDTMNLVNFRSLET